MSCLRWVLSLCVVIFATIITPQQSLASSVHVVTFRATGKDQTAQIQSLLSKDGSYYFTGTLRTQAIHLSHKNLTINFAPGAVWEPVGSMDALFSCYECNLNFVHLQIDGKRLAEQGVHMVKGTLVFDSAIFDHLGYPSREATDTVAGFLLNGVTSITGNNFKASHLNAVGDGIIGNNIGAARGIELIGCGPYQLGNVTIDWTGTDAEEADSFQTNTGNTGGTIANLKVLYNGNTRRCAKYQSGKNIIENVIVHKASDFKPVSNQTDVGKRNFNCISWEANTPGSLDVMNGYIDASGFERGIGNNTPYSTAVVRVHKGVTLIGSTKPVIRTNPQTGKPQYSESYGFYTGLGESGSGIEGAKVVHFSVGASIRCNQGYSRNVTYDDPVVRGIDVSNYLHTISAPDVSGNTIINRTTGYLSAPSVIEVGDVRNGQFNNNGLVTNGTPPKATCFIDFMSNKASATAYGNTAPSYIKAVSAHSPYVQMPN